MLKLYTERTYKQLYVHLLKLLIDNHSIFVETWLVVPNHSAKQWLQKSLAKSLGVCAQIKFIMPLSFNWEILKNVVESNSSINVFSNDVLRWQIFQFLSDSSEFKFLNKKSIIENFNFSEKIAQTLLKYVEERPELINDWDNGLFNLKQQHEWQADIWIKLLTNLKEKSPVQLLQKFNPATDFKQNPQKIILFATEQLTCLQKDAIIKLSEHQDIHMFLSNPCPNEYWFDIKPSASIARAKLFNPELAYLDHVGNPLLANLAYSKMAIFDAFLNYDIDFSMHESVENITVSSLLESVKYDIFHLQDCSKFLQKDNSIKIHSCHSRFREVEIIKDEILYLLDNHDNLNPEDIIVVTPDINDYVFAIKDIFTDLDGFDMPYVPFHIDRVQLADSHYVTALMRLLQSFTEEMSAPNIYELLSEPIISEKFNISEDDLLRIKTWIVDSNIRNFYSAMQKIDLGFENKIGNTWNFGENRWLSGYLVGDTEDTAYLSTYGDIAGQEALFSECFDFLKLWFSAYKNSQDNHSPQDWFTFIKDICRDFLYNDFEDDFEQQINQALENKFIEQTLEVNSKVPLSVINTIVESVITANNYRSEGQIGVRFQSWENAFIVDAKVLIILGLNDSEFPKKVPKNDLDIFNNISSRLNKSTRQRDKNLMLSALTENVETLIMSYIGFNSKTNDIQPPSVILADIINYLQTKTDNNFKVTIHKMHGFDYSYFDSKTASYNIKNYNLAIAASTAKKVLMPGDIKLDLHAEKTLLLNNLCKFFVDPLDFFLKNYADINNSLYTEILKDTETYNPNALEQWQLMHEIFSYGKGSALKTGIISDNSSGQAVLNNYEESLLSLNELAQNLKLKNKIIELSINDFTIFGQIETDDAGHLLSIYPTKVSSKRIVEHWIKHLSYQSGLDSYLYFIDKKLCFKTIDGSDSQLLLSKVLEKWQKSFSEPWRVCTHKLLNPKQLKQASTSSYLASFEESKYTFPSEGQKYFKQLVQEYDNKEDINNFVQPLLDSIEYIQ